jgi:hypothetical protein
MKVAGSLSSWKNWRACRMRFSDKSMPVTRQPMRAKGTRLPPSPQPISRIRLWGVTEVSLLHTFGCVLDSFSKKILERNKDINNNCILSEK